MNSRASKHKDPLNDAMNGLFSPGQFAIPTSLAFLSGIIVFLTLNRFVGPEMPGLLGRYLGNGLCQGILALFSATVVYTALQWMGLSEERRFFEAQRGSGGEPVSGGRIKRLLSGRGTHEDSGLIAAARRWYQTVSRGEDFLILSDHLLLARERQYAMNLAPIQYAVWAMPLTGFIGTVVGITDAIAGLGQVVADTSDTSAGLEVVLSGLEFAFDTTFVGLVLVIPTMALIMPLRARGETVAMVFHEELLNQYYEAIDLKALD